jgi:hypothetical protein
MNRSIIIFILIIIAASTIQSLSITKHDAYFRTLELSNGEHYDIVQLTIEFDGPVYIKDTNAHLQLYSNYTHTAPSQGGGGGGGGDSMCMPDVMGTAGIAKIVFDSNVIESYGSFQNGPPNFLIPAPSTIDPVSSFLSLLGCYENPLDIYLNNTLSFILFFNNLGYTKAAWLATSPTIVFSGTIDSISNPTPGRKVVDSDAVAISSSPVFSTESFFPCDPVALAQFATELSEFLVVAQLAKTKTEFSNLQFRQASILNKAVPDACKRYVLNKLTYNDTLLTILNNKDCLSPLGSNAFAIDPCCNRTLGSTQCCQPHSITQNFSVVDQVLSTAECAHPVEIRPVIYNFADAIQQAASRSFLSSHDQQQKQQDERTRFQAFQSDCQTIVDNSDCKLDSDCLYSGTCNAQMGTCQIDYGNRTEALVSCYNDHMEDDMKFELCSIWNIPYSTDRAVMISTFLPEFRSRVLSMDCIGQSSQSFQGHWDHNTWIDGDQTGCLTAHSCNYETGNQNTITSSNQCLSGLTVQGASFCGNSFGNSQIQQVTRWARCQLVGIFNEQDCSASGIGVWLSDNGWNMCISSDSSMLPDAQTGTAFTAADCFRQINADDTLCPALYTQWTTNFPDQVANKQSFWDNTCTQDYCFSTTITAQQDCDQQRQNLFQSQDFNANNIQWDFQTQRCILTNWNRQLTLSSSFCSTYNMSFHRGVAFITGSWETPSECARGQCSSPALRNSPVSEQACQAKHSCTLPCQRCRTFMQNPNTQVEASICYVQHAMNQTSCQELGGMWQSQNQVNLCISNTVPCPYQTFSCSGNAHTQTQCSNQNTHFQEAVYLGCFWDGYVECQTEDECSAQGQCNDWELQSRVCPPGQACTDTTSECIAPWTYDDSGQRNQCPQSSGNSFQNTWSQFGCIQLSITTQQACEAHTGGFLWKTKATNSFQCINQGSACYFKDQPWNALFLAQPNTCTSCGGSIKQLYQFKTGVTLSNEIVKLQWTQRAWVTDNQWTLTVDYNKLNNEVIQAVITARAARDAVNQIAATRASVSQLLQLIVSDCIEQNVNSFALYSDPILNNVCRLNPGQVTSCGPVQYTGDENQDQSTQLGIYNILAGPYQVNAAAQITSNAGARRRRLLSDVNTALIQNALLVTVGTVVGNGVVFQAINNTAPELCLTRNANTQVSNANFTVPDFIRIVDTVPVTPLDLIIDVRGLTFCANVSISGTYFPAYVAPDWRNATSSETSTPPTVNDITSSIVSAVQKFWDDNKTIIIGVISGVGALLLLCCTWCCYKINRYGSYKQTSDGSST